MTAPRPDAAPPALLPCPFCGEFPHEQAHHDWPCGFAFVCVSSNCNIRPTTRLQEFRADAIAAWNRRAPATDAPAPHPMEPTLHDRARRAAAWYLRQDEASATLSPDEVSDFEYILSTFSAAPAPVTTADADFLHGIVNRFPPAGDGTQRREITLDEDDGQALWQVARRLRLLSAGQRPSSVEDVDFLMSIVNRFPPAGDGTQHREVMLDENDGQALWQIALRLRRAAAAPPDTGAGT